MGQERESAPETKEERRARFSEMGHRGGLKGGAARASKLSAQRRSEIARAGGLARSQKFKDKKANGNGSA